MTVASLATDIIDTIGTVTDGNYTVYVTAGVVLTFGVYLWRRFVRAR
jgi:hypothetical protein